MCIAIIIVTTQFLSLSNSHSASVTCLRTGLQQRGSECPLVVKPGRGRNGIQPEGRAIWEELGDWGLTHFLTSCPAAPGYSKAGPWGLLGERPLWPELLAVPSFPACGLRRWRFPRAQAEAAATPTRLQGPAVGPLPRLPAPPLPLPGQVTALWSPGPNFLLPASSHLWEAPLDCPANFQRLLPQEAISVFPRPPPQVSYPDLEHPSSSLFRPTHRESLGPLAHFPFGSWLNIRSPWPDCEFPSPGWLSHRVLPSPRTVPGREDPTARVACAPGTEPWCPEPGASMTVLHVFEVNLGLILGGEPGGPGKRRELSKVAQRPGQDSNPGFLTLRPRLLTHYMD